MKTSIFVGLALIVGGYQSQATTFQVIRIGDVDGFGYRDGMSGSPQSPGTPQYTRGSGNQVNNDGVGVLAAGDDLPSLNGNSTVALNNGDDFDNRSGEGVSVVGATDNGSTGVEFTDISLSQSYDRSSAANGVWNHNTGSYGAGGAFPMAPSNTLPNQPGFIFDFFVATGDITPTTELFFNLVYGDYDVVPAEIRLTSADGTERTVAVATQPTDGLIQEASVTLNFSEVFTAAGGGYDGYLAVDFLAANEPYTAFDYVEISFLDDPGGVNVPDSGSTVALLGACLLSILPAAKRAKKS